MKSITFIVLFTSQFCSGQVLLTNRSDSIDFVKNKMRKAAAVESFATGYEGAVSMQFQGFMYLVNTLSNEELLRLQEDSGPCLKVYGYFALVYRRQKVARAARERLLNDTSRVNVLFGCAGGLGTVSSVVQKRERLFTRKALKQLMADPYKHNEFWQHRLFIP
jgi:hypothetical protein